MGRFTSGCIVRSRDPSRTGQTNFIGRTEDLFPIQSTIGDKFRLIRRNINSETELENALNRDFGPNGPNGWAGFVFTEDYE